METNENSIIASGYNRIIEINNFNQLKLNKLTIIYNFNINRIIC